MLFKYISQFCYFGNVPRTRHQQLAHRGRFVVLRNWDKGVDMLRIGVGK